MALKLTKYLWFVYQDGLLDFIATTRSHAEEMSVAPDDRGKAPYKIERWKLSNGKYEFDRKIKWGP